MRIDRSAARASVAAVAVVVVIALLCAGIYALGVANPATRVPFTSDVAGPFDGEPSAHYAQRTRAQLDALDRGDDRPRWALVAFDRHLSDRQTLSVVASTGSGRHALMLRQVALQVPLTDVRTPTELQPSATGEGGLVTARIRAADRILGRAQGLDASQRRAVDVAAFSAAHLTSGCACVIGVVVRGVPDAFVALAGQPDVFSVEAMPPDANSTFAVRVPIPGYAGGYGTEPDTGAVPSSSTERYPS